MEVTVARSITSPARAAAEPMLGVSKQAAQRKYGGRVSA
jgi:hypothetical protein